MPITRKGYLEDMGEYEKMAHAEEIKKANRWWRRIPRERKEKRQNAAFSNGFGWAMSAYYVEKSGLAHIESMSAGTYNDYTHFDEGASTAVQILKELKMLGLLQQVDAPCPRYRNDS